MREKSKNSKRNDVGLFGGTFDPVHHGHLNLAIELKERCHLSEVWVIPAGLSPTRSICSSPRDRFTMAKLAFENIEGFKVLDIELERFPSYTIDTLKILFSSFPLNNFALLLGEDSFHSLPSWKDFQEIIDLLPIFVGGRGSKKINTISSVVPAGFVDIPMLDIDATTIRKRIQNKLYVNHLVPAKVLDYIYQNQLYSIC